jgi:protein-tyrosine-phosphatase
MLKNKKVLFVCVHNAGRSQIAEVFFNKLAAVKATAFSAGMSPASSINPKVMKVMQEIGIDLSQQKPKPLTPELVEKADLVVSMGCGMENICPAAFVETEDWDLEDPSEKPLEKVREIRDQIKARVTELWNRVQN